MSKIDKLFKALMSMGGSDLHISEGQKPKVRTHGKLVTLEDESVLTQDDMVGYLEEICTPDRWQHYLENLDLDFAYALGNEARFRCNYFFQENGYGAVFRIIPAEILSFDTLKLPPVLKSFGKLKSGLVLVTGPTGSGKSTTLAAIIDNMNENSARHILTIEEPIEFVHPNKKSTLCQREVGVDVHSFGAGLKAGLRQDVDVILVGEMRDYETISLAISAAATGVLVFGTLHTNSAVKTVDRIIDVFPSNQQDQVRNMLSESIKGVVAQLLLKTADGKGRVAAHEILVGNSGLAASIREGKIGNIRNIIQGGGNEGMCLMDDTLQRLVNEGRITGADAYLKATEKRRFEQYME